MNELDCRLFLAETGVRPCFFIPELGREAAYGVYMLNDNAAFVNLGTSADAGLFSVESIRRWWYTIGRENLRHAERIVVTCDCGGSNGTRNRLWKSANVQVCG